MWNRRNVISFALLTPWMAAGTARADDPMPVVASFAILADFARQIGGTRAAVQSLIGPNQDAHMFQPSPGDARKLAGAKLILINGLGFEPYIDRLIKASGTRLTPTVTSAGVSTIEKPKIAGHEHDHGHDKGKNDPHVWQSVANARLMVANIASAFIKADPAGKTFYEANAQAYQDKLTALEAEIRQILSAIPADTREVAVTHNAFGYFSRDFGISFKALQGISTDAEPSAADLARIIRAIKAQKTRVAFLENVTDPRKIERIAAETGAKIGGTLYSDSLSLPDGPASSYIDMMRHNARQLAEALKP